MIYSKYIKFFLNKLIVGVFILILFPLIVIIFFLLFITQGNPIFFIQMRSGKNLQKFRLYKFRTLKLDDSTDLSLEKRSLHFWEIS